MTFRQLSPLFLLIFLIFINDGASHPSESTAVDLALPGGYVSTWEHSWDNSDHHETVGASAQASKTKSPLRGRNAWHISASGFADVTATEITVGWDMLTPTIIFPSGLYYIHARVDKRDEFGVFRTVKYGNNNTPIYTPYAGPIYKPTYAPYSEEHSIEPNIGDYRAHGLSYVSNSARRESAATGANR